MACSGSVAPATPEPAATATVAPTATPTAVAEVTEPAVSDGDFQCDVEAPPPFEDVEWTEYEPLKDVTIQLPTSSWELKHKEGGLAVYFLPAVGDSDKSAAALTVYGYYEAHVRGEQGLNLSWDEFIQANLSAIERTEGQYRLARQWEVEPTPMSVRMLMGEPPLVQDSRADFHYSGVGDTEIDGYGLNKRIGPYYFFVRLDVCAHKREPDREAVVKKLFDSLSDTGYGSYWIDGQ